MAEDPRSSVPSVTAVLSRPEARELVERLGHDVVVDAVRARLDEVRSSSKAGGGVPDAEAVAADVRRRLAVEDLAGTRRVVNATGVVLHTNLGRAPLSRAAIAAMVTAAGPSTVEYDLVERRRARRGAWAGTLLAELVGAEAGLVVNNGAAALVLALAAVAGGRDVVVSRGELVEIGGSFRLPDVIAAAGVGMVEVGTTNRTRAGDYAEAVAGSNEVGALLRVHPSNFTMHGFTTRPTAPELAAIARQAGVAFVHDVGSGLLDDELVLPVDAADEPSIARAVADGADVVVASGDKLLGGPQAGLLAGRAEVVEACRRHPLARALRVDKVRLAALEATLLAYRRGASHELPTWAAIRADVDDLTARAEAIVDGLARQGVVAEVVPTEAVVGGGTLPDATIPSVGVARDGGAHELAERLARAEPPVVGRVHDRRLVLDLRTVPPEDDPVLLAAVAAVERP